MHHVTGEKPKFNTCTSDNSVYNSIRTRVRVSHRMYIAIAIPPLDSQVACLRIINFQTQICM